jgi:uncharacterized repeat protein (TIGR01451 family)
MNYRNMRIAKSLLVLSLLTGHASAQYPAPPPAPLPPPLYVRFDGPAGMRVTFFRGAATGLTHQVPFVAALRPGYAYRVQISGLPGQPSARYYPTLEVHGSLLMPAKQLASEHPAGLVFRAQDFSSVEDGSLVTKVVALERPDTAVPLASKSGQPLEFAVAPDRDPVRAAQEHGRPLLIVRLGQRQFTPQELAFQGVPGTILLPGERVLPPPRDLPWLPWTCIPLYDPRLGPASPASELCIHDGGDGGLSAGHSRDGRLRGVEPSDTVAEYSDSRGARRVTISNSACLCVPRFIVLRGETVTSGNSATYGAGQTATVQGQIALRAETPTVEKYQNQHLRGLAARERASGPFAYVGTALTRDDTAASGHAALYGAGIMNRTQGQVALRAETQALEKKQQDHVGSMASRQRASGTVAQTGTAVVARIDGSSIVASAPYETGNVTGLPLQRPATTEPGDLPLLLEKWPDKCDAAIGALVTFYLKYSNRGGRPITDIALLDSLPARLEYVPGSARTDRDGVFTMQQNEAGSLILRWEIHGSLPPGQSGIVSFQAKIR